MTQLAKLWQSARREPAVVLAIVVGTVLFVAAVFVPMLADTDFAAPVIDRRLEAPVWLGGDGGLLGTDSLGRNIGLRILHGLRTSYAVALCATFFGAVVGTSAGVLAGYFGGWLDAALMRLTDLQMSLPGLLIVLVIIGILGGGVLPMIIVLGANSWMLYARVIRNSVSSMRRSDFILATEGIGASPARTIARHILPSLGVTLVALGSLEFARLMLAEASLSFLGFGVQPPQVSLGAILASGRDYLSTAWWIATFAGIFLAMAVLATNLVGSWLQRTGDPTANVAGRGGP